MTDTSSNTNAKQRIHLRRGQGVANSLIRTLLATPLLSRAVGRRLVTIYVVGRKSGRRYTIPVNYLRDGNDMIVGTPFPWARNLRTGEPVEVRHLGRRRRADVVVYTDEAAVARYYDALCRDNGVFANLNKIALDSAGNPDPQDIHEAWAAGARVLRLSVV